MIYYTGFENRTRQTAGAKAPSDILALCRKRNYQFVPIKYPNTNLPKPILRVWKYLTSFQYWSHLLKTMQKGDVLIYQHPLYVSWMLAKFIDKFHAKGIKLIVLIHDLETLRKGIEGAIEVNENISNMVECKLLKQFDAVICHNKVMKQYLLSQGYEEQKLICLEMFDYLGDCEVKPHPPKSQNPSVVIAGNLLKTKCGYIYHIHDESCNPNLTTHLFGLSFDESTSNKMLNYHGSFPSAELPGMLEGDFGLVWDGPSAETCAGNTGKYLKYNNPHKTALYLSSGFPVIVWSKAAVAEFVLKNEVGLTVNSLYELEEAIRSVPEKKYARMCQNAMMLSERLNSGYYFYQALDEGLSRMGIKS